MAAVSCDVGPVAVTGASGFVGAHVVGALLARGYSVHACLRDASNPEKTNPLHRLAAESSGGLTVFQADLLDAGGHDDAFRDCAAVLHVGTPMGYGGANRPQQVYDGAIAGTENVLESIDRAGTIKRLVYTSSFAAIGHPAPPGYRYTEADWASDGREDDPAWRAEGLDQKGEIGYAMAKVAMERRVFAAAEADGRFDAIAVCPLVVLGPLLSRAHELVGSWQWHLGRTLAGKANQRGWKHLWNIVDVRDVATAQALILESPGCSTGDRFQLSATDSSGELDVREIQACLQRNFPDLDVGGPPPEFDEIIERHGQVWQGPLTHCDLARSVLGLRTYPVEDTLVETARTLLELGLVEPRKRTV